MADPRLRRSFFAVALIALLASAPAAAGNPPPKNPYLADSSYPLAHGTSAQQGAVPIAGPRGPSHTLRPDEITYLPVGPAHFSANTSGPYPGGRRVIWSSGLDRIVKVDHDSFEVLATYFLPGVERYTERQAEASIAAFNRRNGGFLAIVKAAREAWKLRELANSYTLIDVDDTYYVGNRNGIVTAYGDARTDDPASPIEKQREFALPRTVTGLLVGMNMTFDGWLIVATEHGYVVAIERDFSDFRAVRIEHSEGAEEKATRHTGFGWIRNGFAVDEAGGVYIASQDHVHKVIWTGDRLSTEAADGAWTARYRNGGGEGSGSTPSLMGFGDEDRFVVITDGEPRMNVTLFWRDEIPRDWRPLPGAPDRRIAGMLPADMGESDRAVEKSEQSVVVAGYGALVVDNVPRNVPFYVPRTAELLLSSYLGSNPEYQPFGVQKFAWDPVERRFEEAWVNTRVSSPNSAPIVSYASDRVFLIGARDDRWTLEALDWETGRTAFRYVIGDQRYNSLFSGTMLDEAGRIHYGTVWGRVRLEPRPVAAAKPD